MRQRTDFSRADGVSTASDSERIIWWTEDHLIPSLPLRVLTRALAVLTRLLRFREIAQLMPVF